MSTLSGSGSSFFNMVYRDDANKLSEIFKKRFPEFDIKIISFDNNGLIVK